MQILADSVTVAVIHSPLETINLTEWLFTLTDEAYQACSPAHIAAGANVSSNGKRTSINVEMISGNLLVQHYTEEISEKSHCRVHSHSDSFSPAGRTKLDVTWELHVRAAADGNCELHNRVLVTQTAEFSELLEKAEIADIHPIIRQMSENAAAHNREETPLFALDIKRKALAGTWQ